MTSSRPHRAWVRQPSGRRLDLANPTPFDWEDRDLAIGLARTFRWGGHSTWPRPMSVAQHSILVLALRRQVSPIPLDRQAGLRKFLHDVEQEGAIGFDLIFPLKQILGGAFEVQIDRLTREVFLRFGLPWWMEEKKVALASS